MAVVQERAEQAGDAVVHTAGQAKDAVEEKMLSEEERLKRENAEKKAERWAARCFSHMSLMIA